MASDGTPRITWHGKDFAAITEIVKLGEIEIAVQVPDVPDPWLRRFYAALVAHERIERANRIAPAHVLEMAACRYLEKGGSAESWHQYEIELGVTSSKTRPPRSPIQPFIKWARGGNNDTGGIISRLSGAFDAWLAKKTRPDPTPRDGEPGTSQLAKWLADEHGYQAVAKAHSDRVEYDAALKRGSVWVTHGAGTERVYVSKAAGESQNDGPTYEEPAEWWDLEDCEPSHAGEYRRIHPEPDDENEKGPLPARIARVVRPERAPQSDDQKKISESKLNNNRASATPEPEGASWRFPSANGKKYLALQATNGSEEWYTPEFIFKSLNCMFDLDPASPGADIVPWIPARQHFTLADDGLKQDWSGRFVWLNPPYNREMLPQWIEKFQRNANGLLLCVDRTSTVWWQSVCGNADLILQFNKKIQFLRPGGGSGTNALGSSLVGYGQRAVEALKNAHVLGTLFEPHRKSQARTAELGREIEYLKARITELESENFVLRTRTEGIEANTENIGLTAPQNGSHKKV